MKKTWLAICALLILGLTSCDLLPAGTTPAPTNTPVIFNSQVNEGVIAEGNVVPRDSVRLYTRSGGKVAEVLVSKGELVEANAVILRFGDREALDAGLAAAQLEEKSAQQALDDLKDMSELAASVALVDLIQAEQRLINAQQVLDDTDDDQFQSDLDNLIKDVSNFKTDLDDAQEEFDKYKEMDQDNTDRKRAEDALEAAQKKYDDAVRKRQLKVIERDQLKAQVDSAQAAMEDAQRVYNQKKDGPDVKALSLAEARLKAAQEQVKAAQAAIDALEIRAPFAGEVTSLEVVAGQNLLPNQSFGRIADFDSMYVETNDLTEIEVVKIAVGQKAEIVPDSMVDLSLMAEIESIARESGVKAGDVTYTVRLKLLDSDPRLRWGMTVEVRFEN